VRIPKGNDCGFRWQDPSLDSPCGCAEPAGHDVQQFIEASYSLDEWRGGEPFLNWTVDLMTNTPHLCTCGKTVESARNAS
jgi:hypothetical protein